jgi:hypothetical protein
VSSDDHVQADIQRIAKRVQSLDETVAILSRMSGAKQQITDLFSGNPRLVIIYRGIQKGLTQTAIAKLLRDRNLPGADQGDVSRAYPTLDEAGFIRGGPQKKWVTTGGWEPFGLERILKKTLKDAGVDDVD